MKLLEQVARCIEREQLLEPKQNVYVAVSGGADSIALLTALYMLGYQCEVIHCNFSLRGKESDCDEDFVRGCAEHLGLPYWVKTFDTHLYAKEHKVSIEMAARELRYGWFAELLDNNSDYKVAVGHHADDAVETFLYNLAQGTGIKGLSGIAYQRDNRIVRPLLDSSREDIIVFLKDNPYLSTWREDSSNQELIYRRNYIRHQLIPSFEGLKPQAKRQISHTIRHLRGVEAFYQESIARFRSLVFSPMGINIPLLKQSPDVETLLFELLSPYGFSSKQCYAIAEQLDSMPSGSQYLSATHRLQRSWDYLQLLERNVSNTDMQPISLEYFPQEIQFSGKRIVVDRCDEAITHDKYTLCLPYNKHKDSAFWLRMPQLGDKMPIFGMAGKQKRLSRILIDSKASHQERRAAIVLCDNEQIYWLIPWSKSEITRLTETRTEGGFIRFRLLQD